MPAHPSYLPIAILALTVANLAADTQPTPSGQQLFQKTCSACHGTDAKGGRCPDLTSGRWKWGSDDTSIARNILHGIPGTQMPAFAIPEQDALAIVRWLRQLKDSTDAPVTGDAEKGQALFFGAAGCVHCHMFGGQGGRLGPDLSHISTEKSVAEMKKFILHPGEPARDGYRPVEVRTKDDQTHTGAIRNEDAYSLQMMDEHERLRLFWKSDLREIKRLSHSLMPDYPSTGEGLDDLIAFLKKGDPAKIANRAWKPAPDFDVSFQRIRNAKAEPQNWLTYWGDLRGTHYSPLKSIDRENVSRLRSSWTFQFAGTNVEATPLVVDGVMFVTGPLNNAAALDARTGRTIWRYTRNLPEVHASCTVMTNRGLAILGDRVYMATLDAHLIALDAKTGNVVWDTEVADYKQGFSMTLAPLAIDGKIVVGITSGECALVGFVDAYDAANGKRLWRTFSIAQPGDPARATWSLEKSADIGGGPTWMTGTYDVETNTLYWTTGNPGADYDGGPRPGDNLYTCSVLALDPVTGKIKWYFQFTPHDTHDWDANEAPVLIDAEFRGRPRKLLIQANRNAFYYVLDRTTGEFLLGKPFAHQTWANGLDDKGRPMVLPNTTPTPTGTYVCPDDTGATNWAAPSYDASMGLLFVPVREGCATYSSETLTPHPGEPFTGGGTQQDHKRGAPGAIRAIDAVTGNIRWNFPIHRNTAAAGVLATAGGLVLASDPDGSLIALNSSTGALLWRYETGGEIQSAPISYSVDGKQYVAVATDTALFIFGLE